ncbi:MAG: hypothetical protein COZ70_06370 [Deltaproteobacteria bacterium CG_4_8_14_3_um_filter_51_11]|nr:hypothetical protein [bacterium]OIP43676.1 MAG: hypothetical protein AUK25_00915 [Desulfobacteraceae bacterium CG2_30_51_40]PIP46847.1 MAG: hypothetical protein COX16_07605 [Deltaproteobacteria bacterium CG23_combo_of_CG06-09_8_20_14_all_51_20]PIX19919.1 MAG: hypothetical protein COZ70_06370 [Deltaproteobacteria bacterium CG_4_8_14_3_um_filter_51_11]PIY26237.1 MAG: hypothetical protein COZ11_03145 [Deltaproteobacteria bacterium CG_4_10_14_3_um_filter_51_14]PJB35376.1 MAG: hypothetical prote
MKSKRLSVLVVFAVGILTLLAAAAWGIQTTAIGEGRSRQEAINNGLRTAVEQALGTMMSSYTAVKDGKLLQDKITSASAGYVKNYDVLAEGKDPVSETYRVKLNVNIDDAKLKGSVEEFMKDPQAMATFTQTKFDDKKVVVVYMPRTGLDLPYDSKAVQTIMDLIQDKLAGYAFRVFLPSELKRIRGRSAEMVVDEETAIDIARQEAGDAMVAVGFDAGKKPTEDGYQLLYVTLTIKAFDPTTGELFANVQDRDKTIARGGDYALQDGLAQAAIKVGPRTVDRLTAKIVERFSTVRQKFVVLILRNIGAKTQTKVEQILEDIGWKFKIARQTGKYLEVEIFSEADPTTVRKTFRDAVGKANLDLTAAEMAGSRVTFDGKETGGY